MSIEQNADDWREIRSRSDSIANAVFLVTGGALTLSITTVLTHKTAAFITPEVIALNVQAWYACLMAIICFLLLKVHLVAQASLLQFSPGFVDRHIVGLNITGWSVGCAGFLSFVFGFFRLVQAAALAVSN